jgi:hypothetical protein
MAQRVNRLIELLGQGQAIYYGGCCGIAGGGLRGRVWPWHRGVMRPYCLDQA